MKLRCAHPPTRLRLYDEGHVLCTACGSFLEEAQAREQFARLRARIQDNFLTRLRRRWWN